MIDGLVVAAAAGIVPVAVAGGAGLIRNWYRKKFLPEGRITAGQKRCDALLDMANRLDADGQTRWADEWLRNAYKAMLRPLAEMEFARAHLIRSNISMGLAVAYAAFVITLLLDELIPSMEYLVAGSAAMLMVVVVWWLQTKLGNRARVGVLVEEKLAELTPADIDLSVSSREWEDHDNSDQAEDTRTGCKCAEAADKARN